jgi:CheY-like chemotaxis protein
MLGDLGYTVRFAHDGKSGIETYRTRQGSIDLVLLDVNMPLMGGKETFEQLRTINPELRVIILTGYGQHVMEQTGLADEADSFLQKPFQVEDLAMKVRQVLDLRKTASATAID